MIRRREFITLLGGAACAWPLTARAQQPAKVPTIGFLGSGTPITAGAWVVAFAQRLRELGWIEERTIKIDLRWAEGRNDRSAEIVTDFVRLKVDVIVTYGSEHIQIAKEATSTIPIVALMGDPVGSGLVASLAHPGGNLTGLSAQNADLNGKRFELLHEIVPNLRRLAVLFNGNNLAYRLEADIVRAAAIPLGLEVLAVEIRSGDDIAPTFAAIATNADALLVVGEPLTFTYRSQISALALAARLPTTYSTRGYVEAGGLMSYGPNFPALFRRMADYVNKILRGTKPEDLPVEQPTRYDLIVNLTTAKALGLTVPESFLLRADHGIAKPPSDRLEDTSALATIVDENRRSYSLEALCKWRGLPGKDETLLEQACMLLGLITGKRKKKINAKAFIWQMPAQYVGPYAETDTTRTLQLFERLEPVPECRDVGLCF